MTENSNLKKFIDRLLGDSELMEKFKAVANEGSVEKTYRFALENSDGDFTQDEFENSLSELMASYDYAKEKLIDDTALDEVAGGVVELNGEKFWEKALAHKIKKDGQDVNATPQDIVGEIYQKELDLTKTTNKGNLIAKGVGAGNHLVNLVTTLGNIVLSCKDMNLKRKKYEDQKLERELKHYNLLLAKDELIQQAKAEGINLE